MEGNEVLGYIGILKKCIKALSKNGRLITTIITISILLNSLLFLTSNTYIKPAAVDFIAKFLTFTSPNAWNTLKYSVEYIHTFNGMKKDAQIIIGVKSLYFLPSLVVSLFSRVTIILASAIACRNMKLSLWNFLLRIPKLCLRTLFTLFHLKLLGMGYTFLCYGILISVTICIDHPLTLLPIMATISFFASIFWIYLSVIWDMVLVILVLEKSCYGLEALGKAEGLVKGKRLQGFGLSFLFTIVMVIIWLVFGIDLIRKPVSMQMIFGSVLNCMLTLVYLMSYTVFYFHCKKAHGEEIELPESLEYIKLPQV